MKVNVYVNWNEQKVYDYEAFLEEMQNEVDNYYDDWAGEWLDEHYTGLELFNLTDSEKEEIEEKMKEELLQGTIDDNLGYHWTVETIEI